MLVWRLVSVAPQSLPVHGARAFGCDRSGARCPAQVFFRVRGAGPKTIETSALDLSSELDPDAALRLGSGDNVTRAEPVAAQAEAGNLDILEGDWNEAFIEDATNFPASQFKDQ